MNFIQNAAKNHHPAAMYAEARLDLEGKLLLKNTKAGISEMNEAAHLGNSPAQRELGIRYQSGLDVPPDAERARRYFRSCARSGDADCEYRLGESLWTKPARSQSETLQSIAWLQLASDAGNVEAKKELSSPSMALDPAQQERIDSLKKTLLPHDRK